MKPAARGAGGGWRWRVTRPGPREVEEGEGRGDGAGDEVEDVGGGLSAAVRPAADGGGGVVQGERVVAVAELHVHQVRLGAVERQAVVAVAGADGDPAADRA